MRAVTLIFLLFVTTKIAFAQVFEWNVQFHGFADNKEFSQSGLSSGTVFGARFSPEVGFRMDSTHRIRIGLNTFNEFGDTHNFVRKVDPVIYYNYQKRHIDFYLGAFPRHQALASFPRALLSDDLHYYRPNLEGFLFQYKKSTFQQQLWIDWTGKQSETVREGFVVGLSGTVKPKDIYFSHFFTLWHNALTSSDNPNESIQDNAAFVAKLGIDLSEKTFLDSLDLHVGGLLSFDRLRDNYDWRTPKGVMIGAYLGYKSFFIQDEWYMGEAHHIGFGDEFYNFKRYNRLDLGWNAFKNNYLEASLMASFHFIPGAMSNQQKISLRYIIGGGVPLKKTR